MNAELIRFAFTTQRFDSATPFYFTLFCVLLHSILLYFTPSLPISLDHFSRQLVLYFTLLYITLHHFTLLHFTLLYSPLIYFTLLHSTLSLPSLPITALHLGFVCFHSLTLSMIFPTDVHRSRLRLMPRQCTRKIHQRIAKHNQGIFRRGLFPIQQLSSPSKRVKNLAFKLWCTVGLKRLAVCLCTGMILK